MTKRLLNLNKSTRIITILLTTLLFLPSIARAEETITYDLTIGGIEVTSDNATDVLGDGKVSFDPETNTLTLNNAILSDDIICNITSLFIDIIGSNSITTNGKPAISTTLEAASPKISIKSTSNPIGSLVLRNTSQETPCGGVVKGNISINAEDPISILLPTSSNFLTMDTTHVAAFGKSYDLMVGSEAVTNINASDILGDGKATYDPDKNTLSLNGVTTSMIYCKAPQPLTIEINGSNTVGMIVGYGGDENPLTIKKSGSSPASLDINPGDQVLDDMGPVFHFSSCTWGDGLYLVAYSNNASISGAYYDESGSRRQFKHSTNSSIDRVIISTPSIWIGGRGPNEYGKFTFAGESIPGILFNASNNTLTLQGADLSNGGDIVSSLPNLTIKLDGAMSCLGSNKITSSDPKATLTFTTEEKNPGSLTSNTLPWEGFAGNPTFENKLVYLPNEDSKFIRILEAPFINYSDGYLEFNGLNDGYGNNSFDCHYTITYGDGTTDSGQNNEYGPTLSVEKELKPCTITAYVEFKDIFNNTTRSDIATAKYFGLINNELLVPYQQSTTAPAVFPALPEGVTVRYKNNTETTPTNPIDENGAITINGLGTDLYYAFTTGFNEDRCYEGENGEMITILNDIEPVADIPTCELGQFSLTIEPKDLKDVTIENISDQTFTGNEIRPELVLKNGNLELQEAKTADDGDYTVSFSNNIAAAPSTAENAPSVTITGKGNYTGSATKTFTITAQSIENADVVLEDGSEFTYNEAKNVPTIKSASVTIGTSTPEVTAPSIPLTAETDYTISYTKNGEAIDANNIINVGDYKMVLTGKGNFSGTKEIPFTINPRPIESPIITLSATEFAYNTQTQKPNVTVLYTESAEITKTIPTTDYDVTYSGDCINVGSYTVNVTLKGNYNGEATTTFSITAGTMTVTAAGYEGIYDTQAHGITVTAPEGATVKYMNQEGTYDLTDSPTYTNAGTYEVHYQVTMDNYNTFTGSATVDISKADITPTVSLEGWTYGTTTKSPNVSGNTGNGEVTYTYQAEGAEIFTETMPEVVGIHTIKASITETTNYNAAEATATFTITEATMTVIAAGYEGTYDGKAHGITVTAPEDAIVKYRNQEGTYELTETPTYINAGSYEVYYQVTMDNYTTVTGSATVEISKADITPTVTLEGWTYGATANTPTITGNTGEGTVTYTYKAEGAESFVETAPEAAGNYTIKASIAETTNYNSGEATTEFTITAATMNITAEGYEGVYDTQAHGITVKAPEGATVQYMNQEGTYTLTEAPTYTNAGTYEVHYQVTMDNYTTVTSSATIKISKADITPTVTLEGWTYGTTANTPSITGNSGNGAVTYIYKAEGADAFGETAPEVVGAHTIKASIAETTNYNAGEATATFAITAATMDVTAEGYKGTYDNEAHGITVTAPEDAIVMYGSQEGTYNLQNSPTYTDAGTYTVYYQVTMSNYTTVTGSKTVEISKANITPTVALEGWTYGTTANTPNITGNTGNGNVTYTYKAEGSETFVDTKPEVVGTHTIKALIAESTNYNAGEATATFTITEATATVTAKGYRGAYDNQPHGITVTAPEGSTVMYGTQEGTYEQSESPTYTNAGNYTVYYQVTKENYTTVTGSVTIEISKADITPTVTLEGWTYGTTAKTPSITGNTGEGTVTYTYKAEGTESFVETMPLVVGTHTVKASIAETTNYNAGEATATFTITAATMTVSAAGHEGTYDNKAHGITVTAPEGSKVMYGSQNGTYNLTEAPTYTDAGTYEVYYQVTMNNYTTVTGSETVNISKAAITPTVTLEGWTYGTTAKTPSITGNTGEGTVTYSYKAEGTESFVETMPLVVGTHTIKASIAETTNYNAGEATTTFTITAATMSVTAAGYKGTYDTQAHGITVTAPDGATVKYGTQEGKYDLTESPTYTNAGTNEVYYQVTKDNYTTVTGSATVEINKADITPTVTLEGWTYGATANSPSVTGNTGEGTVTYSYKAEGTESFVETMPLVVGTHTVKASIAETTNYNAGEATTTFTITAATMTITAAGHEGTYDGKAHGIKVTAPEDATVKYGEQEGSYEQSEAPTYTDAGTYEVYYQVTMDNYTTVTGSATVEISKADITPTVTLEGWTYGATANTPTITGNTGNGTVTYTYKAEGAETFVETAPETAGNYTIKASIAETANYNAGEATTEFTITAATMTVTAKGYEGTYDGKAHGITVSAPEDATIKYGTAEGSYELNASPEYTAGGNYTVYYQVTMDNYATVTGSETVKISKAEAELEFDVPEESKVYATIGKEFTEPTLNNLKGLDVTFSSSDESVATVDKNTGKVTLKSAGLTYITATFAGNDNYNEFAVKYELRVKGSYNLWIDNVQVTSDNYNDILENQKFFYDLVNKWLIITNNETPVTVKSSMPELTIYLNGKSELERIYFDNQGNAQNTGTLSFFNYNDVPGKLTLDTNNDNGVISGFSSISFDDNTKLRFIDPDSCEYKDGLVKMTKPSQLGEIVKQVTIGQYIEPMANGDGISFGNIDSETNITNMTIEDKLLITATQHEEGSNEDDDYIDPNNGAFVMNTTNTSEDVEVLSQGVESGNKQPGSEDYADSFRGGITFMIPSGTGTIELELMNEEGYMLMLKIGTGVPHEIVRYERATVVIDYNVDEPTYVYLYLEEKSIIGARRAGNNTRVNKRDKAHGTVFSVKVKAASVSSTNPLNKVEGATGNITIPDVNTTTPSGDDVPTKAEFNITNDENKVNDDKWYTIDGQRINKPTQKGLYIRNRKKVVVK